MASVSSLGIGSGLDVNSIISQLMSIESRPKDALAADATRIQTQISEVGKITSALSKLRELSTTLSSSSLWQKTTATSSSTAVGVTTSGSALSGNHTVEVEKLASAQSLLGGRSYALATDAVGAGTLSIELGSWGPSQASFAQRSPPASVDVVIEATDTVETLRDKINSSGAGVSASILNDASGVRLVLRARQTGADNGFRIGVASGPGDPLQSLAFDPSAGAAAGGATQTSPALNAVARLNGVSISSATNSMTDVLDGMSLTFSAVTTGPVDLAVTSDSASIKKTLEEFATAYSELARLIATGTRYDSATRKAGPLQGDGTVVSLQTQMRALLGASSTASTAFTRLSDAGLEVQRDGTLSVNATRLDKALVNLGELRSLFSANGAGDPAADGFARRMRTLADGLLNTGGGLSSRKEGLSDKLQRNQRSQERLEQRLEQTQKRLERQYGTLDTQLGSINALSSYVSQQVSLWNRST